MQTLTSPSEAGELAPEVLRVEEPGVCPHPLYMRLCVAQAPSQIVHHQTLGGRRKARCHEAAELADSIEMLPLELHKACLGILDLCSQDLGLTLILLLGPGVVLLDLRRADIHWGWGLLAPP